MTHAHKPHTTPTADAPPVELFLKCLHDSGLLADEVLDALLAQLPAEARRDARALAQELVQRGKLTRYQATMLLNDMLTCGVNACVDTDAGAGDCVDETDQSQGCLQCAIGVLMGGQQCQTEVGACLADG